MPDATNASTVNAVTADEVREIVDDAIDRLAESQAEGDARIEGQLVTLNRTVEGQSEEGDQQAEEITLVRLEPQQVETAKGLARIAATEGLLLVVLLAMAVGVMGWRIVSERWKR